MLMVKAGEAVDEFIEPLPYLETGDIIIDGGNSLFTDTNRRTKDLSTKVFFLSGRGFLEVKREPDTAPLLCLEATQMRGPM